MTNKQLDAAKRYAIAFYQQELKVYKQYHPDKYKALSDEKKQSAYDYYVDLAHNLINDILGKTENFFNRVENGLLHPDNKVSRQLFSDVTGIRLPKTVKGTHKTILENYGPEIDKIRKDRQDEKDRTAAEKQEKEAAKMRQLLGQTYGVLRNGGQVGGEILATLCRYYDLGIAPRTMGVLDNPRRIKSVGLKNSLGIGKMAPQSLFCVAKTVYCCASDSFDGDIPEASDSELNHLFSTVSP